MITIQISLEERWPNGELAIKASTYVLNNNKYVDPWFERYVEGKEPPRYPMPVIDYYSSTKREHIPIGNIMEWYFDVDQTIYHRGSKP